MTITLDHNTITAETHVKHHLSAGTALHAAIARDTEHPIADARLIAAAFAHQHKLTEDAADDLIQVVDALTSNAIAHAIWPDAHTPVEVTITRIGDAIFVEVLDHDGDHMPTWPNPGTYVDLALVFLADPDTDPDAAPFSHGRGLVDVAARAEYTTAFREGDHKVVRAVLNVSTDDTAGGTR